MILTPDSMRNSEKYAVDCGISLWELMCNAGYELSEVVRKIAYKKMLKNVVILCGKGNNGGDGYVCANHLVNDGLNVSIINIFGEPKSELAIKAFSQLDERVKSADEWAIMSADIIIDAVFGTGFNGELSEDVIDIFNICENSNAYRIACDCPSGVDCLNGKVSVGTFHFDETVTFHSEKIGCLLKPASEYCGEITVCDIGIPYELEKYSDIEIIKPDDDFPADNMPERACDGHKGTFGKANLICGSKEYRGAALMSVMSALRSGVGLVELFSDKEICDVMFSQAPEAIYSEISKYDVDTDILKIMSKKSTATLIGCGLGKYDKRLVEEVILKSDSPVIVDADGINLICENINVVLNAKEKVVLTPHPAELSRICGVSVEEILKNRLFYAVKTARELNCIVVAKGADTFITDGHTVYLNCVGNTSLSKGGSGDILAGLICGIVAQGVNPLEACACGCYILGKTAEVLSESYSERGIVGSDIISAFPYVFKILDI